MAVDVVLVDDVPEARALVRTVLRLQGDFRVVGEASTGAEGVAVVERRQPQIVVLDLGLSDLSGMQVLTRLREVSPRSRIVVFTGRATVDARWIGERAAAYVTKDEPDRLLEVLESLPTEVDDVPSIHLPGGPQSLSVARAYARSRVRACGVEQLSEDAVLVVSELAANAVEHARSDFDLRVGCPEHPHGAVRIEVRDNGHGTPEPGNGDQTSERGRGLFIVSALCDAWGVEAVSGGKMVWAEITTATDREPEPSR